VHNPDDSDNVVPLPRLRPPPVLADVAAEALPKPTPPPVVAQVFPGLTEDEVAALNYYGEQPRHFVAIVAPAMGGAMQFQDVQPLDAHGKPAGVPKKVVVFQVAVPIDPDIMPADVSTMIDPTTRQPMLSERLRKAMVAGAPMMLRLVVRKSALSESARAAVEQLPGGKS
jgi:hypothetical protein